MNTLPNFFIAGAPRCGTTALSEYLRRHPQVFMTIPKEPNYFAADLPGLRFADTPEQYADLFRKVGSHHLAIGEASVWYLYSKVALDRIRQEIPHARIIVSLRNPIDFVRSLHARLLYSHNEDRANLAEAWAMQDTRREGRELPRSVQTPELLQYREIAMFGRQISRLFDAFPREQVRVVLLEEWRDDPRGTYLSPLEFLGLDDDGRTTFPKVNEQRRHRLDLLGALMVRPPAYLRRAWNVAKRIGGPGIVRYADRVIEWNAASETAAPMPDGLRASILAELAPDIALLGRLVGRDFARWTPPRQDHAQETP